MHPGDQEHPDVRHHHRQDDQRRRVVRDQLVNLHRVEHHVHHHDCSERHADEDVRAEDAEQEPLRRDNLHVHPVQVSHLVRRHDPLQSADRLADADHVARDQHAEEEVEGEGERLQRQVGHHDRGCRRRTTTG